MTGRVAGKVAVVTAAGAGIGRASAIALTKQGATVIVSDLDGDAAVATAELIGDATTPDMADVPSAADVEQLIDTTVVAHGRIDVPHNNAYWAPLNTPLVDTALKDWERTMQVTLTGTFLACKRDSEAVTMATVEFLLDGNPVWSQQVTSGSAVPVELDVTGL